MRKKRRAEWQILITGFDAFGKAKENASEEILKYVSEELYIKGLGAVPVDTAVLETCCQRAWRVLKSKLKQHRDSQTVLVLTGLADFRLKITPERVALNLHDYRIKDNCGHQGRTRKIEPNADNALITGVPVDGMIKALRAKGIPCEVSNHAGTFVCNEVYFKALRYQEENPNLRAVLFVHVPLPESYQASLKHNSKSKQPAVPVKAKRLGKHQKAVVLQQMAEAVALIAEHCLKKAKARSKPPV